MSYNSNTHYTPRYGKNHSKKVYDSASGGREGITSQGNQSSSTYIGSAGKDREASASSLSYSSSRRDTYSGSGYRSRYESYTPKTSSSSSNSYYRNGSTGGSTYYGPRSHPSNGQNIIGGVSGNSSNNVLNRRRPGFDRYDSYSKYSDGNDKFISRAGNYSSSRKSSDSASNYDVKEDKKRPAYVNGNSANDRLNNSMISSDQRSPKFSPQGRAARDKKGLESFDFRADDASKRSATKEAQSFTNDSRKSSISDMSSQKFSRESSRNVSRESSRRSSIIKIDHHTNIEAPTQPESTMNRDSKNERNMALNSASAKPSVEEPGKSSKPMITKKTSFTDYLKSTKIKAKEEKITKEKSDETINYTEQQSEPSQHSKQLLTEEKDKKSDPKREVNLKDNNDGVKVTASCGSGPDTNVENLDSDKSETLQPKLTRSESFGDTSLLSPVNESDTDFNFNELAEIPETKNDSVVASNVLENIDENGNVSEAETVIADDLPRLDEAKELIREQTEDTNRHKLKKTKLNTIFSSDEEEEDVQKPDPKLEGVEELPKDGKHSDIEDLKVTEKPSKGKAPSNEPEAKMSNEKQRDHKLSDKLTVKEEKTLLDNYKEHNSSEDSKHPDNSIKSESKISRSKKLPYKLKRDSSGRSLLQRACKKGNFADVQDYIERGASANEKDFCGFTCLHEAALEGHTQIVKYLIENGAHVNAKADEAGDSETPLIDAAENKHLDCVKVLLENDADPTIFNIDGFTALTKIYNEHEGEDGYEEIIQVLEEATANFNSRLPREVQFASDSPTGNGPIMEDPNDNYFADLIKGKGIYKYAAENSKEKTAEYFVAGHNLEGKPDILILAARNGHAELVDIILGLNPTPFNIDTESSCGVTALLASIGRGHFEVVDSLLSKGADPFKTRKKDGLNALEIAQHSPHFDSREVSVIMRYMEKKSGTKILSGIPSRVVSQATSRATSRAPSVPVSSDEDEAVEEKEIEAHPNTKNIERKSEKKILRPANDHSNSQKPNEFTGRKLEKTYSNEERKRKREWLDEDPKQPHQLKKSKSDLKLKSSEREFASDDHNTSENHSDTFAEKGKRSSASPPAPPSQSVIKAQEEQKIKDAEETRLWQEKVEAKKRARREMFLKSEKEKEQKRKEEEEMRAQEEKRIAKAKREEQERLAREAEEQSKELEEKKVGLRQQLTLNHYPIGLRYCKFDGKPDISVVDKYLPFYVFVIEDKNYVVDLQVSLITSTVASKFLNTAQPHQKREIDTTEKNKLWKLFFKFIGIDPRNPNCDQRSTITNGQKQFQNLLLHFVEADSVEEFLKEFPEVHLKTKENQINVSLESLSGFSDCFNDNIIVDGNSEIDIDSKKIEKFIPPHLNTRKDIIRTVSTLAHPLW
ncbi:SET3 histone deacetylase complex subunit, putative [Candida dubliniensis CD36]|uniref:Subunit of the meiotic-specific repressor of sporulation-specific genes SET3 complex with deaceylase activity, putative n=1 Tax=Candida dubliniensis (strain CD36 / ATCC MYA-646 / CBS 7987 / NCPF 3949 / NRRL Y-17841) TaxID=573826 RepID=B9W8P7_CANDC|nr:SET3 histone deacetylase complex subunit, putative [Candida dubliniensis CD36]CAX45120.1 SET3 histone deacetylase complex subunit, putative [Candida dubliniensis CD36]